MTRARRVSTSVLTPSPARIVSAQILAVATSCALSTAQVAWTWVLVGAAVTALLPFLAVGRRSIWGWCRVGVRYATGRTPEAGVVTEHTDASGRTIGMFWHARTVTCTLEVRPLKHASTVLGRSTASTQHDIPLHALVADFIQHDISVCALDITVLGFRTSTGSPAAEVYEDLIGPLPAAAVRRGWIAVTLDIAANRSAIEARGGARIGACRAASVAATRVSRTLQAHGIASKLLSGDELVDAELQVTRGVPRGDLTATWSTAPLPGGRNTGFGVDVPAWTPESLVDIWSIPSSATGLAIHLRPSAHRGRVRVQASCRLTTIAALANPDPSMFVTMAGVQRDGLLSHSPIGIPGLEHVSPITELGIDTLRSMTLPAAGCGQLLGSDADGNGVACRLFGPGLDTVQVAGELYLARQLVFRAVATGARVLVRTDRPHAWTPLVDAIGAPNRLAIQRNAGIPRPTHNVLLIDLADFTEPAAGLRHRPGTTVITVTEHPARQSIPDLSIVQPNASGDRIIVRTGTIEHTLTLVTVERETSFIGHPRSLRRPVSAP